MAVTATRGGLKTWDLNQTTLIVNNVALSGFGDGDVIGIARESDDYTMVVGADGEATYSAQNNRSGTITVTLGYGSAANATMMALVNADRANNGGVTNIKWKDKRGTSFINARGRVQRVPDMTLGREVGFVEWPLLCGDIDASWTGLPQD